ncbi:MAG: conjugal transfer protein TraX [Oscillospiraceae bacterium]|nr:conjugal transfer protein TraX [Oscillospiraceae bacterium]
MIKLDAYKLKIIAIVGMILCHATVAWWGILPPILRFPMYAAGGLTFPIMAYFIAEGYKYTSNLKRYILRILIFGLIALPFHILTITLPVGGGLIMAYPFLNIMFSIVVSLLVLVMYDKMKIKALFWVIYVVVIVPLSFVLLEWYFIGVTMVLMLHIIKNETARRVVPPIFAAVLFFVMALWSSGGAEMLAQQFADAGIETNALAANTDFGPVMMTFSIGILAAAFLLLGYNGKRGKRMKWLFYIIYPLHFVVLLAGIVIFNTLGWM